MVPLPETLPDKVNGLPESFSTVRLALLVNGAEMVSPELAATCWSKAPTDKLLNVIAPPLPLMLKAPLADPTLREPTVMGWFKLMV